MPWQAPSFESIATARRHDAAARLPLQLDGQVVGSVAIACLDALREHAPWLVLRDGALTTALAGAALDAAFAQTHRALQRIGLVTGWRDETYSIVPAFGAPPLARIERAAARSWGSLTFGAHANGHVVDAAGRPTHLWVAQRAWTKPTDPGLLDNLVGGGVPWDQTPRQTLVREGWEEAGLDAATMARAVPGRVIELKRELPDCSGHGLQWEQLFVFDLALPAGLLPRNQDGEVESLRLLPVDEALALAAGGAMTVDAALVTLDFALRHRLLAAADHARLAQRTAHLFVAG